MISLSDKEAFRLLRFVLSSPKMTISNWQTAYRTLNQPKSKYKCYKIIGYMCNDAISDIMSFYINYT